MPDRPSQILIVDGDQASRSLLAAHLRNAGLATEIATTAAEAIAISRLLRPHLTLFEHCLTDLDGILMLSELRRIQPDMIGVVLTRQASLDSAIRAVDAGVAAYLTKPADLDRVLVIVEGALQKQALAMESLERLEQASGELARRREAEAERERLRGEFAQLERMASLGTLAASVAHEINSPLGYILFNLESLLTDLPKVIALLGRFRQELAERVDAQTCAALIGDLERYASAELHEDLIKRTSDSVVGARKVLTIARDMRAFSRSSEERRSSVSIVRVVESVLTISQNELRHRARIVKELGNTPPISGSEGRLSQVILNLLMNAAQAIEEGDPEHNEIRIRTWTEGGEVRVEVRDTGSGIPEELLEKIFDPFFTTKRTAGGSGLGLPICHDIVTSYGGQVEVESSVGKGTRFVVRLPLNPSTNEFLRAATPTAPIPVLPHRPYGRVLVIDDEPGFGAAVQRMIGADFEVAIANSGPEGRALLELSGEYDLILCDLLMPKVSGMALHEWLSDREPDLARRMIFMTGGAFTPRAHEFIRRTASIFLEKPFEARLLRDLLLEKVIELGKRNG